MAIEKIGAAINLAFADLETARSLLAKRRSEAIGDSVVYTQDEEALSQHTLSLVKSRFSGNRTGIQSYFDVQIILEDLIASQSQ